MAKPTKTQAQEAERRAGHNAMVELIEAFPTVEDELMELFSAHVFKEIPSKYFEQETKRVCARHVRECVLTIKHGVTADIDKRLINAYFDVARYQTDCTDAAIEWDVDEDVLRVLLKRRPPSDNPEERRQLAVPRAVTEKREIEDLF